MSQATAKMKMAAWQARGLGVVIAALASLTLSACGSSGNSKSTNGSSAESTKLIVADISFPCSLNDYAKSLCAGFTAVEKELPSRFKLEVKNGINFADTTEVNDLIRNSTQLHPGGVIIFPNGPDGQVPVLKQACAQGIKIIILDSPVTGLGKCQSSLIAANNHQLGVNVGKWLIAHPPISKEVGIVNFAPGTDASTDARAEGFTKTIEAAGYKVVATVATELTLDKTRTGVTNMLTAHPHIGTIFSTVDQIGDATAQAVKNPKITQLTIDGSLSSVKRIPSGLSADAAQDPYFAARQSVLDMVKVLEGKTVPALAYEPTQVVDKTNVKAYIAAGGLH